MRHNSYLINNNLNLYDLNDLSYSTVNSNNNNNNSENKNEMWKQVECRIKDNLKKFESTRKYCAYCGIKENDESDDNKNLKTNRQCVTLGRCYGCQMVYYCSQDHQQLDWLESHMPKCAELEWVSLCELIQSLPITLPLTSMNMAWPDNSLQSVNTWTDWLDLRLDLLKFVRQIAKSLHVNFFSDTKINKLNRREPSFDDLVDGLLAKITDSMTYSLTIGDALLKTGINPHLKPICIHILHPPNELINDLVVLFSTSHANSDTSVEIDQNDIDAAIKRRFYELCNMFPYNKGFEIVLISPNTLVDNKQAFVFDWSKVLPTPFSRENILTNNSIHVTSWQGGYSHYIKYVCKIEGYSQPDLVVSFHANFNNTMSQWNDDLKIILANSYPCLFTFYDKDEKQKAFNALNSFRTNFICLQANQFSSLLLKQMSSSPNHIYSTNSFYMIISGFVSIDEQTTQQAQHLRQTTDYSLDNIKIHAEQNTIISGDSLLLKQRSRSIHDLLAINHHHHHHNTHAYHQNCHLNHYTHNRPAHYLVQNDACIQTLGVEEPENSSLIHINGKIQINKSFANMKPIVQQHKLDQNINSSNNPLLNMIDIYIDENDDTTSCANYYSSYQSNCAKPINTCPPMLDFSSKINKQANNNYYTSNFHMVRPQGYSRPNNFGISSTRIPVSLPINHQKPTNRCYQQPKVLVIKQNNYEEHDRRLIRNSNEEEEFIDENDINEAEVEGYDEEDEESSYSISSSSNSAQIHANQQIPIIQMRTNQKNSRNDQIRAPFTKPRVNNIPLISMQNKQDNPDSRLILNYDYEQNCMVENTEKPTSSSSSSSSSSSVQLPIYFIDTKTINTPSTKPRVRQTIISAEQSDSTSSQQSSTSSISNPAPLTNEEKLSRLNPLPKPRNSLRFDMIDSYDDNKRNYSLMNPTQTTPNSTKRSGLKKFNITPISPVQQIAQTSTTTTTTTTPVKTITTPIEQINEITFSKSSDKPSTNTCSSLSSYSSNASTSPSSSSRLSSILDSNNSNKSKLNNVPTISANLGGIVNQMKNIFESPRQQSSTSASSTSNSPRSTSPSRNNNSYSSSPKQYTIKKFSINNIYEPAERDTSSSSKSLKTDEDNSEYINVSSKYISYSKQNWEEIPPPPLPPVPPPLPASSPPHSPKSNSNKSFEIESLMSSPFRQPAAQSKEEIKEEVLMPLPPQAPQQHKSRLLSAASTSTNYTIQSTRLNQSNSEFRILNPNNQNSRNHSERSTTPSGKSVNSQPGNLGHNKFMIKHIPDAVDHVKLEYEGQRRIIVPGYMTSADILRNMLLKSQNGESPSVGTDLKSVAPIIVQRQTNNISLKEKLLQMQNQGQNNQPAYNGNVRNQNTKMVATTSLHNLLETEPKHEIKDINKNENLMDEDDELAKKFTRRARTRSMSGVLTLDLTSTQVIDIDLDYDIGSEQAPEPVCQPVKAPSPPPKQFSPPSPPPPPPSIPDYSEPKIEKKVVNPFAEVLLSTIKSNPNQEQQFTTIDQYQRRENSARSTSTRASTNGSRRIVNHSNLQRQAVAGSFDPNDFDSFDEDEENDMEHRNLSFLSKRKDIINLPLEKPIQPKPPSPVTPTKYHIPMESIEKIREAAILEQKQLEKTKLSQPVQFDPNDFDSFDEEDDIEQVNISTPATISTPQLPVIKLSVSKTEQFDIVDENTGQTDFLANRNKLEAMFKRNTTPVSRNETPKVEIPKEVEPNMTSTPQKQTIYAIATNNQNTGSSQQGHSNGSNFFRSALDRISHRSSVKSKSKSRSSSVPLRTLLGDSTTAVSDFEAKQDNERNDQQNGAKIANMKTLQIMNKMQQEYEEKQRRRKMRREQQKLLEEQKKNEQLSKSTSELAPKSPKSPKQSNDRKFLSSIMNTLFSGSSSGESSNQGSQQTPANMSKSDAKRLSLRKLKAKDKAKKKGVDDEYPHSNQSDCEETMNFKKISNQSLNITMNHSNESSLNNIDLIQSSYNRSSSFDTSTALTRFGKIRNELKDEKEQELSSNNKENLMRQLKAELDEEIKDRQMLEHKQNIINGTAFNNKNNSEEKCVPNGKSSTLNGRQSRSDFDSNRNRKVRSKSVTFLDEMSTDDDVDEAEMPNFQTPSISKNKNADLPNISLDQETPSSNRKSQSLKNGDVRLMCGALTGAGPIRSIMKKSATDLSIVSSYAAAQTSTEAGFINLPQVKLSSLDNNEEFQVNLSTTPNTSKKNYNTNHHLLQSDL